MVKNLLTFGKEGRCINLSYKITDTQIDTIIVKKVVLITITYDLCCSLGVDDYGTRFFHISGKDENMINLAFDMIKAKLD